MAATASEALKEDPLTKGSQSDGWSQVLGKGNATTYESKGKGKSWRDLVEEWAANVELQKQEVERIRKMRQQKQAQPTKMPKRCWSEMSSGEGEGEQLTEKEEEGKEEEDQPTCLMELTEEAWPAANEESTGQRKLEEEEDRPTPQAELETQSFTLRNTSGTILGACSGRQPNGFMEPWPEAL